MNIKIENLGDKIAIHSPYNPDFTRRAKLLGGTWNAAQSAWVFDARSEANVRALLVDVYGSDGSPVETATVRVTLLDEWRKSAGPLVLFGRVVASAKGRDSGARLGEGVSLLQGRVASGGSVKNWVTMMIKDSVFEMFDVPMSFIEGEDWDTTQWQVEVLPEPADETMTPEEIELGKAQFALTNAAHAVLAQYKARLQSLQDDALLNENASLRASDLLAEIEGKFHELNLAMVDFSE